MAALPADDADWASERPERLRALYAAARAGLAGDRAEGVTVAPWHGAGASGLGFTPEGSGGATATVVWFHGGGWIAGSPGTHVVPVSHLAALTRLPAVSARYRLAPEHRFPAQVEDTVAAVRAVLAERAGPVVLAGDSAGAAIAFWAAMALAPAEMARVAGIAGFYGAYGAGETESMRRLGPLCPGVAARDMAAYHAHLGIAQDDAAIVDRVGAEGPPVWLLAAGLDPLRDDSRALAARLGALGREVTLDEAADLPHGFLHLSGRVPAARDALRRAARWIAARAPAQR